jgi:hypothetical protein
VTFGTIRWVPIVASAIFILLQTLIEAWCQLRTNGLDCRTKRGVLSCRYKPWDLGPKAAICQPPRGLYVETAPKNDKRDGHERRTMEKKEC